MLPALLERLTAAFRDTLGDALTGVYLHGSLAGGGFRWDVSDIDLLAVVSRDVTQWEKEALLRALMAIEPDAPPKGIEMSVVRRDALDPFLYPTPFLLHYSPAHRARAQADPAAYCRDMHGTDPDLAAHAAMTRAAGRVLTGEAIEAVFGDVPRQAMLDSLRRDLADAQEVILRDPVYVTLNLCRAIAYRRCGLTLTKADGAAWGLAHLPEAHHACIRCALAAYTGGAPIDPTLPWRDFAACGQSALNA